MIFENKDCKIYYEDSGQANAGALIFIHGFPLDHSMWHSSTDYFKSKYRVISYDIRGLGKSSLSEIPFTFEFLVDDLIAIMDYLKISQAVLIGLSMGGYVALRAMEKCKDRFQALILCDTQAAGDNNTSLLGRYQNLLWLKEKGLSAFAEKFITNLLSPKTLERKKNISGKFREMVLNQTSIGLASALMAIASRTSTEDFLPKIDLPVLLVVGEDDRVTPPQVMKEMSAKIKGSDLVIISETGHMAPMENPELFQKIVSNFLEKNHI